MEFLSLAMGAVGLGMQLFGGAKQAGISQEQAAVSRDEARQEQGINDLKQRQMEMDARRQQLEQIRVAQRTASLAQARATEQGAQYGSGLQGGLAQITDQSLVNLTGINQAVEIGRGINTYNQNISADKMKMADLGGQDATAKGISSLGGAIMKAGPITGQIAQGFGSFSNNNFGSSFMGGGSSSGYGK